MIIQTQQRASGLTKVKINSFNGKKSLKNYAIAPEKNYGMLDYSTSFKLDDVITDAIFIVNKAITPNKGQIVFEPNYQSIVYTDRDMVYSIIYSLITNALKLTPQRTVIKISSKIAENMVNVSISNLGTTISREKLERLFQAEADSSRSETVSEMIAGLELLLCRLFAEKNNGELLITSEDEQGITFTLKLPKK